MHGETNIGFVGVLLLKHRHVTGCSDLRQEFVMITRTS
jgi:hypothetical protein